jgi:hypothetical protein
MLADVCTSSKPFIDEQIGEYNSRFFKKIEQYFRKNKLQRREMNVLIP